MTGPVLPSEYRAPRPEELETAGRLEGGNHPRLRAREIEQLGFAFRGPASGMADMF